MFNKKLFEKNPNYFTPIEKSIDEPIDFTLDELVDDLDIDKIKLECKKKKILLTKNIDGKRVKKTIDELKEELDNLKL